MATPVIMPRQGQSVESCIISTWEKKVGDKVNVGDVLFTYETDKASFEEVSKVEGTMLDIFFEEGDDVECLLNVCVIGNEGEETASFNPNNGASEEEAEEEKAEVKEEAKPVATATAAATVNEGNKIKISPRAKALADKMCADLGSAVPTGPHGRIIERDVEKLIDEGKVLTYAASEMGGANGVIGTGIGGRITTADLSAPKATEEVTVSAPGEVEYEEVKNSNIRKVIAKSMHASLSQMAQLTISTSFDATKLLNYRKLLKANGEKFGMEKVTLNDMILFAVSRVLPKHPELNTHFYDDKMLFFKNVHLGIATDTPKGLLVPTVFNANKMSLKEISDYAKVVTGDCKEGKASPDILKGASFTVTNLGNLGIESFTPVVNPPQTAILGVCTISDKVKEVNGEIKVYKSMGLSLTFDHRAVDGSPAARFLKDLADALANFDMLLGL